MTIANIEIALSDGKFIVCAEKVSEHFAITPIIVKESGENAFNGGWTLTHIPTGLQLFGLWQYAGDFEEVERTANFGNVRTFARWLEEQLDCWSSDEPTASQASMTAPLRNQLASFRDNPESWSAP